MADIQTVIDALQDAKVDKYGQIRITDEARCAMVRILMKSAELLKEYAVIKETMSKEIHETAKMFRRTAGDNEIPLKW